MEKTFQISLAYIASLAAFFGLSSTDATRTASRASGMPISVLVALVVLTLNLAYLVLAIACLFAVLKRGLFILRWSDSKDTAPIPMTAHWERFSRRDGAGQPPSNRDVPILADLAWNIDNYYMVPVYSLIILSSVLSSVYVFVYGSPLAVVLALIIAGLYAVPLIMFYYLIVMNKMCHQLVEPVKPASSV